MEAFTSLLGTLSKLTPALTAGTSLASLVSNLSLASKEKAAMDRSVYYAKHPEAISAIAAKLQQPLSAGLVTGTENVVNSSLAEQGLSQAPNIQSMVTEQALAPYQQNAQQMALTAALQAIGLPVQALSAIQSVMSPQSLSLMLKSILPQQATPTGTPSSPNPEVWFPTDPASDDTLAQWGPTPLPQPTNPADQPGVF